MTTSTTSPTSQDSTPVSDARLNPELLARLVCPVDHQDLRLEGQSLTCTVCGRVYPIEDGIPNMLVPDDPAHRA